MNDYIARYLLLNMTKIRYYRLHNIAIEAHRNFTQTFEIECEILLAITDNTNTDLWLQRRFNV